MLAIHQLPVTISQETVEAPMLCALYKTKEELSASVGAKLRYQETRKKPEFVDNTTLTVVGPSPVNRKWFAVVTVRNGEIVQVT